MSASSAGPASPPWRVRFLLQPTNDPSLLIEAAEMWKKRSRKVAALAFDGIHPQEYLLSALGQASGMCPRIEASLKTAAPAGYELDATGAHEFLTETAWGLEQAGFGVLLPAWWTGERHQASPDRARGRQEPEDAGWRRPHARLADPVRLGDRAGRDDAHARRNWTHWRDSRPRW